MRIKINLNFLLKNYNFFNNAVKERKNNTLRLIIS